MKRKILAGLLPLILLLAGIGLYAIALFSRLGGAVDVILRENYRSIVAAENMKESAERMDSGLFFTLAGEGERGRKVYAENAPIFQTNLDLELSNITVPGEAEVAANLRAQHDQYISRAAEFFRTTDPDARRKMYFAEMLPTFTQVKNTAQQVLEINQASMLAADERARTIADKSTRYMIAAITLGVLAALLFSALLQRAILAPLRALIAGAREMATGNLDQVIPVNSQDELGELADRFNKLAASLRSYRQVTDHELVRARQTTESTFSALPDPIFVLRPDGEVSFSNPAAARFLAKIERSRLPVHIEEQAQKVLVKGEDYLPQNLDCAICVRLDDRETFLLPRIVGLRDDAGTHGAAVLLQDVTRFRLLDEVKTNLVSTVSHELKTPLTSVRMGLHLLLEERIGSLNEKQVELVMAAREDSERLLRMINDLLDLARLESGASRLALSPTPAASLVKASLPEAARLAEQHRLTIRTELAEDLPAVIAEPAQIEHVFLNFISNAAKHAPAGSEILIRAERSGYGFVKYSVDDQGPGIPVEHQHRVFDRFFRIPGGGRTGAGLGLAIAREIVTAHGGAIGVANHQGPGCSFYFTLPVSPRGAEPETAEKL